MTTEQTIELSDSYTFAYSSGFEVANSVGTSGSVGVSFGIPSIGIGVDSSVDVSTTNTETYGFTESWERTQSITQEEINGKVITWQQTCQGKLTCSKKVFLCSE